MRFGEVGMGIRGFLAVVLTASAVYSGVLVSTASAAPDTIYCLDGVSTTLPSTVTASSETAGDHVFDVPESSADYILANNPSGGFYTGYDAVGSDGWIGYLTNEPYDPNVYLEAGYTTHYISLGACTSGASPVTHVAVCKLLERGDGTVGLFQQISVPLWNTADGPYFDAPAAYWVEGMGLTCDDPVGLGYKPAGYNVAWGGMPDPNNDPGGVRGSGFNNIYPYYTK
jgi:hypothetical protein